MSGQRKTFNEHIIIDDIVELILPNRDFVAKVSIDDLDKLKTFNKGWFAAWNKNTNSFYIATTEYLGYIDGKPKYRKIYLHRYLLGLYNVPKNKSICVDHINHDTLDNTKDNLRITVTRKNTKHRISKNANNKSGYRNVSYVNEKWIVQLQVDGVNTKLGAFVDIDDAGIFAEEMRKKYYGEFSGNGN